MGGGIVFVPGLVLWLHLDQHRAHSTSVAAIVAVAAAALVPFAAEGTVDWVAAVSLFVGAGLGAYLGARLMARVPADWLRYGFVTVLVLAAGRMLMP